MKVEEVDFFKDRFCNECNSQSDVKELYIGPSVIALCADCRKKLIELLEDNKATC